MLSMTAEEREAMMTQHAGAGAQVGSKKSKRRDSLSLSDSDSSERSRKRSRGGKGTATPKRKGSDSSKSKGKATARDSRGSKGGGGRRGGGRADRDSSDSGDDSDDDDWAQAGKVLGGLHFGWSPDNTAGRGGNNKWRELLSKDTWRDLNDAGFPVPKAGWPKRKKFVSAFTMAYNEERRVAANVIGNVSLPPSSPSPASRLGRSLGNLVIAELTPANTDCTPSRVQALPTLRRGVERE
jgi:hypothetical protein